MGKGAPLCGTFRTKDITYDPEYRMSRSKTQSGGDVLEVFPYPGK